MVTALVMLNIRTVYQLVVLENIFVIKGSVYEITQCFTLLSTGKQEHKSETIKHVCALSHSCFQKKYLRNITLTFRGLTSFTNVKKASGLSPLK